MSEASASSTWSEHGGRISSDRSRVPGRDRGHASRRAEWLPASPQMSQIVAMTDALSGCVFARRRDFCGAAPLDVPVYQMRKRDVPRVACVFTERGRLR
jgi:hypothetical protein